MKNLALIFLVTISGFSLKAQSQVDTSLVVNGVCGMCQRTIEKAAKIDGVQKASWDQETKVLSLSYTSEKVSLEDIYKSVAASGYDTEYLAATDEAYNGLHACCLYRDEKVQADHQKKK